MTKVNQDLIKQDLYQAVNGDWLKTAKIPADHATTGGFQDLADQIEDLLLKDENQFKDGTLKPETPEMAEFVKYYRMVTNFEQRDAEGAKPMQFMIDRVNRLQSIDDLNDQLADWILDGLPLPINLDVDTDMKHSDTYALYAGTPNLFLPDKTYYEDGNEAAEQLMPIFSDMTEKLLTKVNFNIEQAQHIVADAKAFDAKIAPLVKSAEESADISKTFNPRSITEFYDLVAPLNMARAMSTLIDGKPTTIILPDPHYYEELHTLLNDENFTLIKHWMLVKTVNALAGFLSDDLRVLAGTYSRALSGRTEARPKEKSAYYLASGTFYQVIGDYYGRKYFGEAAKADVTQMVKKMIAVYEDRLTNNTWLSDETKKMAVKKLKNLGIQVGYPDKVDPLFSQFHVDENGTVLGNALAFDKITTKDSFSKWNQKVDRTRWEMSANTVNAYYHPFHNIIVFPAAILQAPFYSLEQSSSANFGGIGAVIAHEISHAFDNNGALFDEIGNMNNWWTKEDTEHFQELAKDMIKEFDGIPFAGQKVNGTLTVSENIADAGGLSCALEAAKGEDDVDLATFFINWATIWRMKFTTEYQQLLLSVDVHAPAELRANVQVKNLEDFFKTFDVKEGDKMYLAPDDRVKIW